MCHQRRPATQTRPTAQVDPGHRESVEQAGSERVRLGAPGLYAMAGPRAGGMQAGSLDCYRAWVGGVVRGTGENVEEERERAELRKKETSGQKDCEIVKSLGGYV